MKINLKDGRFINIDIQRNNKGVYEYYSDGVRLGVYDPNTMKDSKFLSTILEKNNTLENEESSHIKDELSSIIEQVEEEINSTDIEVIEEEAEENRALGEYLRELGVNSKNAKKIAEHRIDDKEKRNQKAEDNNDSKQKNNAIDASKVNKKTEIKLDEAANNMQSVKRLLEVKSGKKLPEGSYKIAVISSNEMRSMKDENGKTIDNSSTQYGLALIRKDKNGKMVAEPLKKYIPQLEQSHNAGTNPIKAKNQIETNGEVEKDPILSEYRIGRMLIDMDQDHLDDMEVHFGEYSAISNDATRTELRTNKNTYKPNAPIRGAATDPRKGVYAAQKSNEELDECKDDKKNYIDGDGNPTTKSQDHVSEMAREILDNSSEISDNYNQKDVENHLRKMIENNKNLNEKDIIEAVTKEMEKTAELEHEPRGTENNH